MFGDEEGDKEGHPLAITIVNVAYPSGQPASQPASLILTRLSYKTRFRPGSLSGLSRSEVPPGILAKRYQATPRLERRAVSDYQ